jgi:flagellar hook-associated protein 1
MSLLSSLLIGQTGLRAAQAGINATSHNVANASTPGATRRTVATSTAVPVPDGPLWRGQGVSTDAFDRPSDRFLIGRRVQAAGVSARTTHAWEHLRSLERVLDAAEGTTSKSSLDGFFDALTRATADPSDLSLRRGVIRAAQDVARFVGRDARAFHDAIADEQADAQAQLPIINDALQRVATLNQEIAASSRGGLVAGDLMDQRDRALRQLGELAGVTVEVRADGVAAVYIDDHVAAERGTWRPLRWVDTPTGGAVHLAHSADESIDVTDGTGGNLGAHFDVMDQVQDWLDQLDAFTTDFVTAVNTTHAGGFDQDGNAGIDVFTWDPADPSRSLTVNATLLDDAALLAFAGTSPAEAGDIDNLRALIDLESATMVGGTRTAKDALTALVAEVGGDVATLESQSEVVDAQLRDLDELHENLHGIDLDEEANNLMLYQAAYQASARVISTSSTLVDTLLELV